MTRKELAKAMRGMDHDKPVLVLIAGSEHQTRDGICTVDFVEETEESIWLGLKLVV